MRSFFDSIMQEDKIIFIRSEMILLIAPLSEQVTPQWGKMTSHQMIEHLTGFFNVSVAIIIFPLMVPEEHLFKYRQFLYSDTPFRENTKAPAGVLGENPLPVKTTTLADAKNVLKETVENFFLYFKSQPAKTTMHPVFGMLNFDEWVMLHYKHVQHHLRQFKAIA